MGKRFTLLAICGCLWFFCQTADAGNDCREWMTVKYAGVDKKIRFGNVRVGECFLNDSSVTFHDNGGADYEIVASTTEQSGLGSTDTMHITIDVCQRSNDLVCDQLGDSTKCPGTIPAGRFNLQSFNTSIHPDHKPPSVRVPGMLLEGSDPATPRE